MLTFLNVNVAQKFADGTRLALFYYNPDTGSLENQYQLATVTGGYAEFSFNHCSSYVFIEESALASNITSSSITAPKMGDMNKPVMYVFMMAAALMLFFGVEAAKKDKKHN